MALKKVPTFEYDGDGDRVYNLCSNAMDADWIRGARLQKLADAGDMDAKAKLEALESEDVYYDTDD
jgi:hypothetical protein